MIKFAKENDEDIALKYWNVLIVDDNKQVHTITKSVLKLFSFENKFLNFTSAYSAKEAIEILKNDSKYALVLLDVVMEEDDSGLVVAKAIRETLKNEFIRIILRTGESGILPEETIFKEYDIHDYKDKTELTSTKLSMTIISALRSYRDIIKLKKYGEYIRQESKYIEVGKTVAMISHQWKQPLTSASAIVLNNIVKYELETLTIDSINKDFLEIEKILTHLGQTVDEFSNFFKPSKNKEEFEILKILENSLELLSDTLTINNINVIVNYQKIDKIKSYKNEIKHVFLNIINNAKDALILNSILEPFIKIDVYAEDGMAKVIVEDNAKGIDKDIIEDIFSAYVSTKGNNGTGLGLYMSKVIIQEHCQGTLNAENINDGARFIISIPLENVGD